jgi:hypothetical protein
MHSERPSPGGYSELWRVLEGLPRGVYWLRWRDGLLVNSLWRVQPGRANE